MELKQLRFSSATLINNTRHCLFKYTNHEYNEYNHEYESRSRVRVWNCLGGLRYDQFAIVIVSWRDCERKLMSDKCAWKLASNSQTENKNEAFENLA